MKLAASNVIGRLASGAFGLTLTAAAAHAATLQVKMQNLGFVPQHVTAHVGDTVTWSNADFVAHTATARNGAWDVTIPANATKSIVVKAPGSVEYYCKFHPNMTGTVDVMP